MMPVSKIIALNRPLVIEGIPSFKPILLVIHDLLRASDKEQTTGLK